MRHNRVFFSLVSCTLAAVLTALDCHKNFIPQLIQQARQTRALKNGGEPQRSIASVSNSINPSLPVEDRFRECPAPTFAGGRTFAINERDAQASFAWWAYSCGLRLQTLNQDLPALWHYCKTGVVGSCLQLTQSVRARLSEQGLEEDAYPTRALETLEAAEANSCEGGIISSCEFAKYYARLLEKIAGFPSERTVRKVEGSLSTLCQQSHPGACGELGLRLASSGRVDGNADDVTEGVRLLSKACVEGQTFRCSQIGHFEDEVGREVVLDAVRRGCFKGETASCLYLFQHPADRRDRAIAKQWLWRSCRTAVPGDIDQIGQRACSALGLVPARGTRAPTRL